MHTTAPHFVQLCRLLVQHMEQVPQAEWEERRDQILDHLMESLKKEELVFDRAFSAQLFDQLSGEDLSKAAPHSPEALGSLRERVRQQDYFNTNLMETLGDRILWVMGSN